MNLIEQLGGYEKAKEILSRERNSENIDPVIYLNGNEILIDAICDALLEYRRQHNIFEKEDFVVHIFYKGSKVQRVKGVAGDYIYVFSHDESYQYKAYGPDFRHANDEEIKAGKRLEVKSEN